MEIFYLCNCNTLVWTNCIVPKKADKNVFYICPSGNQLATFLNLNFAFFSELLNKSELLFGLIFWISYIANLDRLNGCRKTKYQFRQFRHAQKKFSISACWNVNMMSIVSFQIQKACNKTVRCQNDYFSQFRKIISTWVNYFLFIDSFKNCDKCGNLNGKLIRILKVWRILTI